MPNDFLYDRVPYVSTFQPQLFPDRFATLATLLGLKPAPPAACRYLELGCGEGDNLIGFAFHLPESSFIGVDLSKKHIEKANRSARDLGLRNIEFIQKDVADLTWQDFGEFDYIAAHGLYSWVPAAVRKKILSLYAELLVENGVGYLSFNTLPGGYLRQMSRDMMMYHTATAENDLSKVEKGISLLTFLQKNVRNDPYFQEILNNELKFITDHDAVSAFHDEFGEINQPFYFHQFVSDAAEYGLKYLCESEYAEPPLHEYSLETAEMLESFGDDIVKREQYFDFLRCRRFRQTLLCPAPARIERNIDPQLLTNFFIAAPFSPVNKEAVLAGPGREKFRHPNGVTIEIEHGPTKIVLESLGRQGLATISFEELLADAKKIMAENGQEISEWENERRTTAAILLKLYKTGMLDLHVHKPLFMREVSEQPKASRLAQWQLSKGDSVTTVNIRSVKIDDSFFRNLILMLDGSRTRLDLKKELRALISRGELADVGEKGDLLRDLSTMLKDNLKQLADLGLLVE